MSEVNTAVPCGDYEPIPDREYRELLASLKQDALFVNEKWTCPRCFTPLRYFSGVEELPAYDYCPNCMDWAYSDGMRIARLV